MFTTIINASAGSGKTYRLAIAYIQALLMPQPDGSPTLPQQVLATTFTRAAASEILERVLRRLALAVVSDEERKRLLEEIGHPGLTHDDLTALLGSVCESLPMLQIGTIDALFARIIRVIGLDLAFPTAWRVADETEKKDLALEAADRMLRGAEGPLSRDQWRRYSQFKSRIQVRAALVKLLEETRFLLADATMGADDPDLARPLMLAAEEAALAVETLEKFDGLPRTKKGEPNGHWLRALATTKNRLAGEMTLIDLLDDSLIRGSGADGFTYQKIEMPVGLREILAPFVIRAREDLRRLHGARLPALAAMARRYHEFRRLVAYAGAAYGFAEIEAAARLLPEHIFQEDIYFRLDGQVRHLLLDEFQDTSLSQFRFLWPIMREVRSENRLLFVVGDVKQSIYGWRGADRRLLNELRDWLDPEHQDKDLETETLTKNRRSAPSVLTAVDRIFGALDQFACLDPETYGKESSRKEQAQVRQKAARSFISNYCKLTAAGDNQRLAGRVRLLVTVPAEPEANGDEEADETPGELETILTAVMQHRQEDPNREVAILCRRKKWIPSIIAGLRLRGVEASGEGGSPVTDSAAVELVLSMLTWLDHPGHTLARGHVELSGMASIFGVVEAREDSFLPKRIQTTIMRNGLAATVAGWIRHEAFQQRCSVHDQIRCEQLVELARHWDAAGGGRLAHFVARVRAQSLDNPISSRVRVMTVHGSKGLEFEAVILADLQSRGRGGGDGPRFLVTMTTPETSPEVQLVPSREVAEILGMQDVTEGYQQKQFEEDLSVLYVGLTRAKSYLDVVLTAPKRQEPSLAGILFEGWGHVEGGHHVVEENAATILPETPAQVHRMAPDSAMWEAGKSLDLARFRPAPDRLASITPSGQEGAGVVKLGLILNTGNNLALERGTAVHALLSRLEWLDSLPELEAWIQSIPEREAREETCRQAARELYPRLRDSRDPLAQVFDAAAWLSRWKKEKVVCLEVWRERRFAVVLEHELMNGSFDRVVCGFDAKGKLVRADILDFKTDRLDDDAGREERRLYYQPQLDAYARALSKLANLPPEAIQTQLVWIN